VKLTKHFKQYYIRTCNLNKKVNY